MVGVTLSAVSEIEFHFLGFVAALISSLTGVFQTIFTKRIFDQADCDPILLHFHTSAVAIILMIPLAVVFEGASFIFSHDSYNSVSGGVAVPFGLLFISVCSHYLQTISSTLVLSRLSVTSHQVFSTLKRYCFILVFR